MIELLTQFMPMFSVLWIAWYAKRRVEYCEARCSRELERILARLPLPPAAKVEDGIDGTAVVLVPVDVPPAPLPVARVVKT